MQHRFFLSTHFDCKAKLRELDNLVYCLKFNGQRAALHLWQWNYSQKVRGALPPHRSKWLVFKRILDLRILPQVKWWRWMRSSIHGRRWLSVCSAFWSQSLPYFLCTRLCIWMNCPSVYSCTLAFSSFLQPGSFWRQCAKSRFSCNGLLCRFWCYLFMLWLVYPYRLTSTQASLLSWQSPPGSIRGF